MTRPIVDGVDKTSHPHAYLPKYAFEPDCIGQHFMRYQPCPAAPGAALPGSGYRQQRRQQQPLAPIVLVATGEREEDPQRDDDDVQDGGGDEAADNETESEGEEDIQDDAAWEKGELTLQEAKELIQSRGGALPGTPPQLR